MKRTLAVLAAFALTTGAYAQVEGPASTQVLVNIQSKSNEMPALANMTIAVNGKKEQLTSWSQVPATGSQIAILVDDGLRESVGRELGDLKTFVAGLPQGTEIFIGYMRNGGILTSQNFTTDLATASSKFRLPEGSPGISASPYFCLSEFVKHWPSNRPAARFVMMITNGVDPYNGSTSVLNQDSPYVQSAIEDAQRAGVSVSSIYFADSGFAGGAGRRGGPARASFSGQGYLSEVSEGTGGTAYYEGQGNPVSMSPFLAEFQHAVSETFIATFPANASGKNGKDAVRIKVNTDLHNVKVHAPAAVQPGNMESGPA